MKKLRFLLLDACVVIKLFQLGIWRQLCERCEVLLAETVAMEEARFYLDEQAQRCEIDLSEDIREQRVSVVSVDAPMAKQFLARFDPIYAERLDPGETESLAYLFDSTDPCLICSSDAIVFRVLAWTGRQDQGFSLEEVLRETGLGRTLPEQYTRASRLKWTRQGQQDMVRGIGMKPEP
jgi:hypothetical protein